MKYRVDVVTLLRHLGLAATRQGSKWVARCPNPDHDDGKPSWSIIDRPGQRNHGSHHCFACGFGGGPWELAAAVWDVTTDEAGERIQALFGKGEAEARVPDVEVRVRGPRKIFKLPLGVRVPDTLEEWFPDALAYLRRRATDEQILRYRMGFATYGPAAMRVVLPVVTRGALKTYSARAFIEGIPRYDAGREAKGARPKEAVFGEPFFDSSIPIATTAEGCFSALALERAGAPNPHAILSSELTPGKIQVIRGFREIWVASDPDAAGEKLWRAMQPLGRWTRLRRLRLPQSPDDVPPDELSERVKSFFA